MIVELCQQGEQPRLTIQAVNAGQGYALGLLIHELERLDVAYYMRHDSPEVVVLVVDVATKATD